MQAEYWYKLEGMEPAPQPPRTPPQARPHWSRDPARTPERRSPRLTAAQFDAIEDSIKRAAWAKHPLHVSVRVNLFRKRYYLALIGGEDRRIRPREDTNSHGRLAQGLMILGLAGLLALGGGIGVTLTVRLLQAMAA